MQAKKSANGSQVKVIKFTKFEYNFTVQCFISVFRLIAISLKTYVI